MALRKAFARHAAAAVLGGALALSGAAALAQDSGETASTSITINDWSVQTNPLVPSGVAYGLGGLVLLLGAYAAMRGTRGWPLRVAFGAAAVATLFNPEALKGEYERLPTEVVVVVDNSASQRTIGDRAAVTAEVQSSLMTDLQGLPGVSVRIVDAGQAQGDLTADGTNLFAAIDTALADVPPGRVGAVFVLTDGQVHDAPETLPTRFGDAPLHVLVSGREGEFDRRIEIEKAPRFGLLDQELTMKVKVTDSGAADGAGGLVPVTMLADGEVIETREVPAGETAEFTLTLPHGGANMIEFRTATLDGEMTDVNNFAVASIEGVREKLRVLMVSGAPTPSLRSWRNMLTADPAVDLVHFTMLAAPMGEDEDNVPTGEKALIAFPANEVFAERLPEFDLVIFDGMLRPDSLAPMYYENIARYVEDGGALLVASGAEYAYRPNLDSTPLDRVLPAAPAIGAITDDPYRPAVSDTGARHPVTRDLAADGEAPAWGRWVQQAEVGEVRGHVVMEGHEGNPLLILSREGEGRVAMLMSDDIGLWARGFDGGGPYAELLQRTVHWLMKEQDLEEEALRLSHTDGALVIERQTMEASAAPVTLRMPSGGSIVVTLDQQTAPGIFSATVEAAELGLYSVQGGDQFAFASVGTDAPREFVDPRSTIEILTPLTTLSKGSMARMQDGRGGIDAPDVRLQDAGEAMAGDDWVGVRRTEDTVLTNETRYPLFTGLLGLTIVLGLLAAAWTREAGLGLSGRTLLAKLRRGGPAP